MHRQQIVNSKMTNYKFSPELSQHALSAPSPLGKGSAAAANQKAAGSRSCLH